MRNLENFDWGWMNDEGYFHKEAITSEIFENKLYEKFFGVEENDIVLDVGASIGPFTYSILDKKPKKVICVEPSPKEHQTLFNNVSNENVTIVKKGISKEDGDVISTYVFGGNQDELYGISFHSLLKENNVNKIDFLKTDCEGGEYHIFNNENFFWIKENVKKIVGEWHLNDSVTREKFVLFRDTYLRLFPKTYVFSVDGIDIKWDLWNDHFLNYYTEVIIYIDNRD